MKLLNWTYRLLLTALVLVSAGMLGFYRSGGKDALADDVQPTPQSSFIPYSEPLSDLPRYPGAHVAPVGVSAGMGGVPMQVEYFVHRDGADKIADFYRGVWRSQGLSPMSQRPGDGTIIISAMDPVEKMLKVTTVSPNGDGTTDVFAAVVEVSGRSVKDYQKLRQQELGGATLGDAIHGLINTEAWKNQVLTSFRDGPLSAVRAGVLQELQAAGWSNSGGAQSLDTQEAGVHTAWFVKGGDRVRISLSELAPAGVTLIMVHDARDVDIQGR
ncbi:MAG: hypothetical protein GMKNLPBB_00184 [Myxococcota bacterium]|nr:hypothetical protein [Myxococcota bacterium]